MQQGNYDVVVIGSGMGGMSAATLLAHAGYKILVIEKRGRLGGRFSTMEYQGFKLPSSAIGIETGGDVESVFREVGVDFKVNPMNRMFYWVKGEYHELPGKGGLRALLDILNKTEAREAKLLGRMAKELAVEKFMSAFRKKAAEEKRWEKDFSFRDWLLQYTDNENVLGVFQSIIAANHAINSWELPASEFFGFVAKEKGYRNFGIAPQGNIVLVEGLAKKIKDNGGDVWTSAPAKKIIVRDGTARGVVVQKDGKELEINSSAVISNAGPRETVPLVGIENFDPAYLEEMNRTLRPAPIVTTLVGGEKPFIEVPGVVMVVGARRVCGCWPVTHICPDLAPPGQHLTVVFGQPLSSLTPMNGREEIEANIQDLIDTFPLFTKYATILRTDVRNIDDEWPCYRTWPGYDLPQQTPITNLYHVGDGVKPHGKVGLPASAETGKIVAERIKVTVKPAEKYSS